jgi:hypothetical protein
MSVDKEKEWDSYKMEVVNRNKEVIIYASLMLSFNSKTVTL